MRTYYQIQEELRQGRYRAMADAFLCWKLPKDACADPCACDPTYPHDKFGTNLLTFQQALEMFKSCIPPECFGLDDCSSNALANCSWADKCGKHE